MQFGRQPTAHNYSWYTDSIFLLVTLGGLFFILLGSRPLFVPDEGRYAEIAREMFNSKDYVTPYLDHIKYFEKPVLFYWLSAAAIKLGGLNLWSLRSTNALLAIFGCLLTYITTRQLYDRSTGLLAALILGTSVLYFVMAHTISLDLPVTVFLTACLYAFLLGIQHPPSIRRRLYLWSAALAAAFAVLTKGLIGIVFPALIIGVWIAIMNDWRLLKSLYLPSCIIIFLAVAAPWHLLVGQRNPGFLYFYFIEQHFLRYTSPDIGHDQPVWFFLPCLCLGFFPWIVFLPQAIAKNLPPSWKQRKSYANEIFLILWATLIFVFFSFSKSKLIPYILPILPPLAILTALYIKRSFFNNQWLGLKISYLCLFILVIVISHFLSIYPSDMTLPNPHRAKILFNEGIIILIGGTLLAGLFIYRRSCKSIKITIGMTGLFLLILLSAIPSIDSRSILPLAKIIRAQIKPQDEIVTYNQYYQDLPFYLQRRVSILNWRNELSYGMQHQNNHEWLLVDKDFWQHWNSQQRVFALMVTESLRDMQKRHPDMKYTILGRTSKNILISNYP